MTHNQTILILGASRGIGEAIVHQLAKDSSLKIYAFSRNIDKMNVQFEKYENVSCHAFDLEKEVLLQAENILKNIPSIDFIINNAGFLVNKPFTEITHDDFVKSYQINVIGIIQFVQASMIKLNKQAHIVNISSIGGIQGSVKFPGLTAYSTSKAALCSFTEMFAEEHKNTSLKMNCLCLGAVQTEMLAEAFPGYLAQVSPEKMAEYIVHFTLNAHQWMNGKIIPVSLSTP